MTTKQKVLKRLFQSISILGIITTVGLIIYGYRLGVFQSPDTLSEFIMQVGHFAPLLFIAIQAIQVVVPIIPGGISSIAGMIIFGPVYGFVYNYIGIIIGSTINFLLARRYGKTFVLSIVSKKTYKKYMGWLDKGGRFDKLFALAIFLPVAPDDYLCMIAGLTKMKLKKFTTIILLCKPVSLFVYSLGLSTLITWATTNVF